MRLVVCIFFVMLVACEAPVLPSPLAGRYYGFDTVESVNFPFIDTVNSVSEIYLDVVDLTGNYFDVKNDLGFWVREGELLNNKLNVNVNPFEGKILLFADSIVFNATGLTDQMTVTHNAILTR